MSAPARSPSTPFLLGWSGVIPFAALTLAALIDWNPFGIDPEAALAAYGACILSFLGGAQWGVLLPRDRTEAHEPWRYAVSVLPQLLAFGCLLLPERLALLGLIVGFLGLVAYDLSTVRAGLTPPWYGRLRPALTGAVVLLLAVAAIG